MSDALCGSRSPGDRYTSEQLLCGLSAGHGGVHVHVLPAGVCLDRPWLGHPSQLTWE